MEIDRINTLEGLLGQIFAMRDDSRQPTIEEVEKAAVEANVEFDIVRLPSDVLDALYMEMKVPLVYAFFAHSFARDYSQISWLSIDCGVRIQIVARAILNNAVPILKTFFESSLYTACSYINQYVQSMSYSFSDYPNMETVAYLVSKRIYVEWITIACILYRIEPIPHSYSTLLEMGRAYLPAAIIGNNRKEALRYSGGLYNTVISNYPTELSLNSEDFILTLIKSFCSFGSQKLLADFLNSNYQLSCIMHALSKTESNQFYVDQIVNASRVYGEDEEDMRRKKKR